MCMTRKATRSSRPPQAGGDAGVVRALGASGKADANGFGDAWRPLVAAALNGCHDCLEVLLAAPGIKVNAHDGLFDHHGMEEDNAHTALTAAAAGGQLACLHALLAVGGMSTG